MLEWVGKRTTLSPRVVTAIVFYVLRGSLTFPFLLNNLVEMAAPFITWSATHDVVTREINLWKSFDLLLGSNLRHLACLLLLYFRGESPGCRLFSTACLLATCALYTPWEQEIVHYCYSPGGESFRWHYHSVPEGVFILSSVIKSTSIWSCPDSVMTDLADICIRAYL